MRGTRVPGKVILGSGYHTYNGIAVEHVERAVRAYVRGIRAVQ